MHYFEMMCHTNLDHILAAQQDVPWFGRYATHGDGVFLLITIIVAHDHLIFRNVHIFSIGYRFEQLHHRMISVSTIIVDIGNRFVLQNDYRFKSLIEIIYNSGL